MDIYILDKNFNILEVFSTYDSIVWNPKFHEPGIFKAQFIFSTKMNAVLQTGNLLYKTDEDEPGVITRKYLTLNKYGEETIQVQGYMASRYLNQRIIWDKMLIEGSPELVMRQLVYEQAIEPKDPDRVIPRLRLGDLMGYEGNISKQISYDNLQEALTDISKTYEIGYRIRLDVAEKELVFETYRGTDRTYGSETPCIFTRSFKNVYTQKYSEDSTNYRNVCLVGGKGEDSERVMTTVGRGAGLDRYEMFYSASGLSDKDITAQEYTAQLQQKGSEKLSNYYIAKAFESQINQNKAMKYDMGDYVTCKDNHWNIMVNTQIKEITKGYSKKETSCTVTFGDNVPTLIQLIKAKE